jgi:hypothetical protein
VSSAHDAANEAHGVTIQMLAQLTPLQSKVFGLLEVTPRSP